MVTDRYKRVATMYLALACVINLINGLLWISGTHYTENFEYGILANKQMVFINYPGFEAVEIIFGVLLVAITVLVFVAEIFLKEGRETGIYLSIGTEVAIVLWSVLYPTVTYSITCLVTPMLTFCIVLLVIYVILSVLMSVYFLKANYII